MVSLEKFKYTPRKPEKTKEDFIEACKTFFEKNPDAENLYILGFIPYFNDGDACVFGIKATAINYAPNEEDGDYPWNSDDDKKLKWLDAFEETMQRIFGDHFQVTINRKLNVQHTEYEDHD